MDDNKVQQTDLYAPALPNVQEPDRQELDPVTNG